MERTEPTLVPEWLRCSGNVAGGGTSVHHSDVSSTVYPARSRSFRSNFEKDSPRFLERSLSSNSRSSLNGNGSAKHPYSSFTRSHRDKNREKEKSLPEDIWHRDSSDPLASVLTSRVERNPLGRSQSMVTKKPGEVLSHRVDDSKSGVSSPISRNSALSRSSNLNGNQKVAFERDFPSLGTEEKQGVTGIRRILSPGVGSAVQSLPTGNSGFLGGEKWTSALAEVPAIIANNGMGHTLLQQSTATKLTSAPGASNTAGLNMAEALSQPPARSRATPQLADKSQRLEELAIKQSRQLIPVTPSMPKPLVTSAADKSKQLKVAVRTSDMIVASRGVQQQPHSPHPSNPSRSGQNRPDSSGTSHVGKFLVLKPGRENGATTGIKDVSSPTCDANGGITNGQLAMGPPTPNASRSQNNSMVSALENKAAALSLSSRSNVDKRMSQSLARSRSEFFNLMRRKTSPSATTDPSESSFAVSSTSGETSGEGCKESQALVSPRAVENGSQMICNGDGHGTPGKNGSSSDVADNTLSCNDEVYPDEEEAAFLRSLGWEENGGEDEGLTEEEINAFYQEYMNRRPSLKMSQSSQPESSPPSEFHKAGSGITTRASSSSASESEA